MARSPLFSGRARLQRYLAASALVVAPLLAAIDAPAEPMPVAKQAGLLRLAVQEYGEGVGSDGRTAAPAEIAIAEEILRLVAASAPSPELARMAELVAARAAPQAVAEAFGAWMAMHGAGIEPPLPAVSPSVAQGKQLFERYCTSCHGGAADGHGPLASLIEGPPPANFGDGEFMGGETPAEFFQAISFGVPGTAMPQWDGILSEAERWDLVAFLWTVRAGKPEAAALAACRACHAPGAGAADLTGPGALAALSDTEVDRRLTALPQHPSAGAGPADGTVALARGLSFAMESATASTSTPEVDVRHIARALDLIVSEYRGAVAGGAVVNAVDYGEARLFHARLAGDLEALVSSGRLPSDSNVAEALRRIEQGILARAEPAEVEREVASLSTVLLPRLGLERVEQAALASVRELVDRAEREAAASAREAADRLLEAYMAFEPVERRLAALDPDLAGRLERTFTQARAELLGGRPARAHFAALRQDLARAEKSMAVPASGHADFITALLIIVREGLEAILVISALAAYLTKAGHLTARTWLYGGAVVGIGASLATAFVIEAVLGGLGLGKEVLEGITMLVAAGVLFSVSYWLISKVEARHWQRYIRERLNRALGAGSNLALAGASFLAVYREGFETVLFFRALVASASGTAPVTAGFAFGCLLLVGLYVAIARFSVRIPIRPFFTGTGILLYVLAFRFLGAGIAELQAAGTLPLTPVVWWPDLPVLDMAGNLETAAAQLAMILAAVAAAAVIGTGPRSRAA